MAECGEDVGATLKMPRATRAKAARYGIGEWYGQDVMTMTPEQRKTAARIATGELSHKPDCPFMATLSLGAKCNKKGGVCTIRQYEQDLDGSVTPLPNSNVATTCPARFLGTDASDSPVLRWVAEKMLDSPSAVVIKETPFLQKILHAPNDNASSDQSGGEAETEEAALPKEGKKAGRIDWLLLDPSTQEARDPTWCAVETQAVYFSGGKMGTEFEAYMNSPTGILFPAAFRRPDYRSSGPKRLAPQLMVKVPVLRNWGKKVAVVVDKFFFESMSHLPEAYPRGTDKEKRDNCDVAWFVVDYDDNIRLKLHGCKFSTLDASVEALNATEPMSKETFTGNLKALVSSKRKKSKKIFSLEN